MTVNIICGRLEQYVKSERMSLGGVYHGGDGIVAYARWLGLCSIHCCLCTDSVMFQIL